MDIKVVTVWKVKVCDNPSRWAVELQAGNVIFQMRLIKGRPTIVSRRHIDAQAFDPENLWVPKWVYAKICRQGAAILRQREERQLRAKAKDSI